MHDTIKIQKPISNGKITLDSGCSVVIEEASKEKGMIVFLQDQFLEDPFCLSGAISKLFEIDTNRFES